MINTEEKIDANSQIKSQHIFIFIALF